MRRALILFLLTALAAPTLPARTDVAGDLSDAEAFVEQYLKTFNAADPVAMASLYAEDGILLPPTGGVIRGRESIQKFWSGNERRSLSFAFAQKTVCGDVGFFVGSYNAREIWTGRYLPASPYSRVAGRRQQVKIRGSFALGIRREDGKWRVASDLWTQTAQEGFILLGQPETGFLPAAEPGH